MRRYPRTTRLASMLLCAGVVLCLAQAALAKEYHSWAYGYSISVPEDWAQVPEEVLAAELHTIPGTDSARGRVDAAFQAKGSNTLDYPYIIVEVLPYSQIGFAQQVDDHEIRQIVKTNTGLDPANPYMPDNSQVMEGGAELEPVDGYLKFDAESHRFVWGSSRNVTNDGLVRTKQWGFFGKDMLVQVTLLERGKGSDRLRDMAQAVAGSLKFDIGREYQPAFTLGDAVKSAGQMFAAPNMGVAVTMICVGTAVLFAVIALITNRRREPSYEQYSVFDREP